MNKAYIKARLNEELEKLLQKISTCFVGKKGLSTARKYITGLLSTAERKNGWQLAEVAGDRTPYLIQQFMYRIRWNAHEVRDRVRDYVKENLGSEEGVLIVDETGFLKKGKKSAGVMRQYSGTAGRIENSQIGVFITYTSPQGFALIDRELYLPKEWLNDPLRCKEAGIPEGTVFRTKPQQALDMLKSAYTAEMPFAWVMADSVYGDARAISIWLESINKGYVLAVSGKAYVWLGSRQHRVSELLKTLPEDKWERISAGTGTKGERYYDWQCILLNAPPQEGQDRRLLVRRSIKNPDELRAFICFCPQETQTAKLAQIAGIRWSIEQSFEESKGEVGLDHYEVRSYTGWYRHITLACCAHALLAVLRNLIQSDVSFQDAIETDNGESLSNFKKNAGFDCRIKSRDQKIIFMAATAIQGIDFILCFTLAELAEKASDSCYGVPFQTIEDFLPL